jgi:hypothetical protein
VTPVNILTSLKVTRTIRKDVRATPEADHG